MDARILIADCLFDCLWRFTNNLWVSRILASFKIYLKVWNIWIKINHLFTTSAKKVEGELPKWEFLSENIGLYENVTKGKGKVNVVVTFAMLCTRLVQDQKRTMLCIKEISGKIPPLCHHHCNTTDIWWDNCDLWLQKNKWTTNKYNRI